MIGGQICIVLCGAESLWLKGYVRLGRNVANGIHIHAERLLGMTGHLRAVLTTFSVIGLSDLGRVLDQSVESVQQMRRATE